GRLGLLTLACTLLFSGTAVLLGVSLVNALRPGGGVPEDVRQTLIAGAAQRAASVSATSAPQSGVELLIQVVPDNPIKAAANGDYLALMFFALVFGIGLARAQSDGAQSLRATLEGLYEVLMQLIDFVIRVAPIGVFALLFSLTADVGLEVLGNLTRYVGVVL